MKRTKKSTTILRNLSRFYFIFIIFIAIPTSGSLAQLIGTDSYELQMAPDLWFNTVDGVLVGLRFRGEDPRTFLDGPHRLNAGIWLGTRIPETPVSYYISYSNPLEHISGPNSTGEFRVVSSIGTGLHHHEAGLQKRWQPGFDEYVSSDLRKFIGVYRRFDSDYVHYDAQWQHDPVFYLRAFTRKRDRNSLGRWTINLTGITGMPVDPTDDFVNFSGNITTRPDVLGLEGFFGKVDMELLQQVLLPAQFYLRTRFFAGISSHTLPQEHRYLASDAAAFDWMDSRATRARGTIPQDWMSGGWVHVAGGPGLRGYTFQVTEQLEAGLPGWSQYAFSFNMDVNYPNPVNTYFAKIPYLGDFLKLESYLFSDAGLLHEGSEWQTIRMDAGAGFMLSLNIPDYLGQDRGFFIRYELPVWLSDVPDGEDSFAIRHLLGLGSNFRF